MEVEQGAYAEAVGRDLHNSSDYKKAEFNNFFVIHLKIFPNYKKKQAKTGLPQLMLSSSSIAYVNRQV